MKKLTAFILAGIFMINLVQAAEKIQEINLPKPNMFVRTPLMECLQKRASSRNFGIRGINEQTLADILWAAMGVNRDSSKKLTIPTSMNNQDLMIYVLRGDGAWLYNPHYHRLTKVNDADIRFLTAKQDYVKDAAMILIYTSTEEDMVAGMHAGSAYQNVGLYAAARGMSNVVRTDFDKDNIVKELPLIKGSKVVVSQALGWPQK